VSEESKHSEVGEDFEVISSRELEEAEEEYQKQREE